MKKLRPHNWLRNFVFVLGVSSLLLASVACKQKKRSSNPSGGGNGSENNGDSGDGGGGGGDAGGGGGGGDAGGGDGGGGDGGGGDVILTSDSFNRASLGSQSNAALGGSAYSFLIGPTHGTWSITSNALVPLGYDDGSGGSGVALMIIDNIAVPACTIGVKLTSVSKGGYSSIAFGNDTDGAFLLLSDYTGYITASVSGGGDSTPKYYLTNLWDVFIPSASGYAPTDGDVIEAQFGSTGLSATVSNGGTITTLFDNEAYGSGISLSNSSYPALMTVELDPSVNTTIFDNLIIKNCQ